jgi:hypothetical protein
MPIQELSPQPVPQELIFDDASNGLVPSATTRENSFRLVCEFTDQVHGALIREVSHDELTRHGATA